MELVAPHPLHDLRGVFARGAVWTTGARHQHHQHVCENACHSERTWWYQDVIYSDVEITRCSIVKYCYAVTKVYGDYAITSETFVVPRCVF